MVKAIKQPFNYRLFGILVCLCLCFQGCDFIYGFLDKEGAQEKELIGEVLPFEKNLTIEEVQTLLKIYGYDPGKTDGILGSRTRNAIERFQKAQGLKVTKFVDQETWAKLKAFDEMGFVESRQLNVVLVQEILRQEKLYDGKIDGKFGPKTKAAVMEFQKQEGLKVDGKVGYQTMGSLAKYFSEG